MTQEPAPTTTARLGNQQIVELCFPGMDERPAESLGLYLAPSEFPSTPTEQAAWLGALDRSGFTVPNYWGGTDVDWPGLLSAHGFTRLRHTRVHTNADKGEVAVSQVPGQQPGGQTHEQRSELVLSFLAGRPSQVHSFNVDQPTRTVTVRLDQAPLAAHLAALTANLDELRAYSLRSAETGEVLSDADLQSPWPESQTLVVETDGHVHGQIRWVQA